MGKNFSTNNPLQNLSSVAPAVKIPDEASNNDMIPVSRKKQTGADSQDRATEPKEKTIRRKVGRPKTKTEDTRTINIAVPVSVLEKLETVKACYSNNLTLYINRLIEKDIEANFDNYEHIADSLNSFK